MSGIQEASMRSIRPYKTSEEYLEAMKEDLAEWLKDLYGLDIDAGSFLEVLETGVLLCHHANSITQFAGELSQQYPRLSEKILLPRRTVACNDGAQPGTFQARDNVSNFIQWCRKEMGIKEVLMFETEDLVLHKNEKNFVLCLLEVARSASRFGVSAPTLIQMEEEIEEEIRKEMDLPPEDTPLPKPRREPPNFKNLDQMVQHLVSRCTCPVQFPMIKVSEGKYRVGDSSILIFVRILRSHVMVRVGGGWDTLEHYLDKHDPCRCSSLSHKQVLVSQRSQAVQVQHEITARLMPETDSPHKPQVTLMVTRSQSPLPPVEWRTYAARGRRLQSSAVPSRGETKNARVRERPATPFLRVVPSERSPESKQTGSSWSGRETNRVPSSLQKNGHTEPNPPFLKPLLDPQQRRSMERIQAMTPLNKRIERSPASSTASWRDRASQPLKSVQEMCRSPSPMKYLGASSQQKPKTPLRSSQESKDGEIMASRQEDPAVRRSPSPKKHISTVQKGESHSKTQDITGLSFCRPPTPCRSYQEVPHCENGGLSKVQGPLPSKAVLKDKADPQREVRKVPTVEASHSRISRNAEFKTHPLGLGQKMKGYQEFLEQEDTPEKPFGNSHGITKYPIWENKCVYTRLPMDLAEEQALYKSLEDEILSNIKELEEISEENLVKGSLLAGVRMDGHLGEDNSPRLSSPSWTSLQSPKRALINENDVPRSGVYVPEGETRWHLIGEQYNRVIHELSMTLHQAHIRTEGKSPLLCSPLGNKQLHKETWLGGETPLNEKNFTPRKEGDEPCLETHGEHANLNGSGDSPQAMQSRASHSSGSSLPLEEPKDLQAKPKRSLKKPERVPSIYKLKLRPKICPRRDNRPDRRPSRIPAPVAYRYAQRSAKAKGQLKPSSRSTKRQSQDNRTSLGPNRPGHAVLEGQASPPGGSPPSTQGRKSQRDLAKIEGEMGISAGEESWL